MNSARPAQLDLRSSKPTHSFRDPTDIPAITGGDPLLMELVATPAFQRLREIRFLGAIDYRLIPSPNGKPGATRYTRYQHSLGVMRLARLYCDIQKVVATGPAGDGVFGSEVSRTDILINIGGQNDSNANITH